MSVADVTETTAEATDQAPAITSLEERARSRAAELRRQAEQVQRRAEVEISALLTAATELEALVQA